MRPNKHYKINPERLRHFLTWTSAAEQLPDIELTEVYFEPGEGGLVRLARGWIKTNRAVQMGVSVVQADCLLQCTWTYLGMCRDWRNHRLPQYDLDLKEDTKARLAAIKEWNARCYPSKVNTLAK